MVRIQPRRRTAFGVPGPAAVLLSPPAAGPCLPSSTSRRRSKSASMRAASRSTPSRRRSCVSPTITSTSVVARRRRRVEDAREPAGPVAALKWKLDQATAAYADATGENPVWNALDLVRSRRPCRRWWSRTPKAREEFGEAVAPLIATHRAARGERLDPRRRLLSPGAVRGARAPHRRMAQSESDRAQRRGSPTSASSRWTSERTRRPAEPSPPASSACSTSTPSRAWTRRRSRSSRAASSPSGWSPTRSGRRR